MTDFDFSSFESLLNEEAINDIESAKTNGTFEPLPDNEYHVRFDKLELTQSKKGNPMVDATMTITEGKYKNRKIFEHFVLVGSEGKLKGFLVNKCTSFLNSLTNDVKCDLRDGFKKYDENIKKIFEFTQNGVYIVKITTTIGNKGGKFTNYEVLEFIC